MTLKDMLVETLSMTLEETFEHVHGIYLDRNTSLLETLETVSAAEASRPVSATCASLAAQVAHVTFYLNIMLEYGEGRDPGKVDWGKIWRTVRDVTPDEWEASKQELRAAYQRVRAFITTADDWEAEDVLDGAFNCVVHSAYHLGEIRQALCTVTAERGT